MKYHLHAEQTICLAHTLLNANYDGMQALQGKDDDQMRNHCWHVTGMACHHEKRTKQTWGQTAGLHKDCTCS